MSQVSELLYDTFEWRQKLRSQRVLFSHSFPEVAHTVKCSDDHYFWKFTTPFSSHPVAQFCAENSSGGLVGFYAGLPYEYSVNGVPMVAAMVCDVMTSPDARGRGVFTKLGIYSTEAMKEIGFDLATGYPIRPEVIPGHVKAGWMIAFSLPLFGQFITTKSLLKSKKLGFLVPFADTVVKLHRLCLSMFSRADPAPSIEYFKLPKEAPRSLPSLAQFYKMWQQEIPISLRKTEQFLTWRLSAPGSQYHVITLRAEDLVVGVLIARDEMRNNVPCTCIVDLAILKSYESCAGALLSENYRQAKERGADLILIMCCRHLAKRLKFLRLGLIRTPFTFTFILKNLSKKFDNQFLLDETNWNLTWLDSDDL